MELLITIVMLVFLVGFLLNLLFGLLTIAVAVGIGILSLLETGWERLTR